MGLTSGTKLGPYEIVSPLGAGGMGEVYRARDTRLDRDVAIKVLPANLSSDPVLRQRLEREAKAISKLSHPHVCTLHDIGRQDGVDFLVMEYLEGETLEQRLTKGPLPAKQTLRYSGQMAKGLAKAHSLGITHRDLKPSNVMLTKTGAKLMDFGLAKESDPAPLADATELTAEATKLTSKGMIVGTFQYMAPEQLEGKEADARTDVFALGEVIYEMATGKPAFSAKSRASLIVAILTTEPVPISQLTPLTPPALDHVVKKCLAKDPDERWQSASDLASELNWVLEGGSQAGVQVAAARVRKGGFREGIAWALAALALCAIVAMGAFYLRDSRKPVRIIRASIPPEEGTSILVTGDYSGPAVLSPDGRGLAFVASREDGPALLWVREIAGLHARALIGTEGATFPFWSADGQSLGFFAGGKLKTISAEGGTPAVLCDAPGGRGGTWGATGTIVFSPQFQSTLSQVPASGGTPTPVTVMDTSKHDSHRWPYFLPDGRHFLYLAVTHNNEAKSNDAVFVGSLDGKESHMVMNGMTNVGFAGGRLLYMRDHIFMARSFDLATGALHGDTERLAEDVLVDATIWKAAFDATSDLLAYTSGGRLTWQAEWYDRSGKPLNVPGEKTPDALAVRLSPDEDRLAVGGLFGDVWIHDLRRKVTTRLTFGPGPSFSPIWSPDGQWIAYDANRSGKHNLYRKRADGTGQEELLLEGEGRQRLAFDWSPSGDALMFGTGDFVSSGQIWVLPLLHDRKPTLLVKGSSFSTNARFSPDGHWVSYNSTESGRMEVYVVPFGGGAGKWQVSNAGGTQAIWRRDGKELFYVNADSMLVSVPITLKAGRVELGTVHPLFRVANPMNNAGLYDPYDVARDGKSFVIITIPQQASKPITLVTNWMGDLKRQ